MLCTRRSQRVVHFGVRWSVRARVNLWFPARSLAVRRSRSDLGARRGPPMATQEQRLKPTHYRLSAPAVGLWSRRAVSYT